MGAYIYIVIRQWEFVGGSRSSIPWAAFETEEEAKSCCRNQQEALKAAPDGDPNFARVLAGAGVVGFAHTYVRMQAPGSRIILPTATPLVMPNGEKP